MRRRAGRVLFWLVWPALRVYFYRSQRSRVIVRCGEDVLLVRGWWDTWFGDSRWALPGGGMHHSETAAMGAVRELAEELGLQVQPQDLVFLAKMPVRDFGITYQAQYFSLQLPEPPKLVHSKEITQYTWVALHDVEQLPLKPEVRQALSLLAAR